MEVSPLIESPPSRTVEASSRGWVVNGEMLAYIALVVLALTLRLAQLDVVPLTEREARQALAAWRVVYPDAAGSLIVPESPLLFALHSVSFSVLGASEFAARIATALAGALLTVSPLLFRRLLGPGRTLIFSLMLACSPVLLASSRLDVPAVWSLLVALSGTWAMWRYWESAEPRFAILTTISAAALVLLIEPTGVFLLVILIVGGFLLGWRLRRRDQDAGEDETLRQEQFSQRWAIWPWVSAGLLALVLVVLVSTMFLLYPAGLSAVGELLTAALRGLTEGRTNQPFAFPLLVSLFYEPLIWVLAAFAVWRSRRRLAWSALDRFLLGWSLLVSVFVLLYSGAGPEHALWLVFPLTGLASVVVNDLLSPEQDVLWWDTPEWSRWVVALGVVAVCVLLTIHLQSLGRALVTDGSTPFQLTNLNAYNVVWLVIGLLILVIGYFLASSVWGEGTTLRGAVVGLLGFALVTSLGSGWHVAVTNADQPIELWNRNPTSGETRLLRQTLMQLSDRETSGFPKIPVTAQVADDGVVAWLLRDFPNVEYIPAGSLVRGQEILLLPDVPEPPDLGGPYVGQRFVIHTAWNFTNIDLTSFWGWWMQRRTLTGAMPSDVTVLWLRQDVYDGLPADER